MLTLALDTAGDTGSIALVDENGVVEETPLNAPEGFSGILFAEIERILERQGKALIDIDMFAAASGPGSFTGVRIGLAAIKGMAEVMGKPAAGISNLDALASFAQSDSLRAPVINARRGEVFAALLDKFGQSIIPESVLPFPKFLALAGAHEFEFVSSDFAVLNAALAETPFSNYQRTQAPKTLASAIARIAMQRPHQNAAAIEANYVRRSDAEALWKPYLL